MKVQISFTWEGTSREYAEMLQAFRKFTHPDDYSDDYSDDDIEEAIDDIVVVDLTRLLN